MAILPGLFSSLIHVNVVRYLTISGISVLVYDTLLMLADDVRYVWTPLIRYISALMSRHGEHTQYRMASILQKLLVIFIRYVMLIIASLFLFAITPSVDATTDWCRSVFSATMSCDIFIELIGSGVVLCRLFLLWELDRRTIRIITGGLIIVTLVSLFSTFAAIAEARDHVLFVKISGLRICHEAEIQRIALIALIIAFILDITALFLLVFNALSRPRLESQRLFQILYEDGLFFFLTVLLMRLLNIVVMSFAQADLFFIAIIFSGTMVTTVTCRSLLNLIRRNGNEYVSYNEYEDNKLKTDIRWRRNTKVVLVDQRGACNGDLLESAWFGPW
ncbi:uncharacterized protein FOMMEDRAFT_18454 [Fomitiporia mediterranea MF3/22]|uniref:uncharacterized protein n=1 Tax=Fomitiporia mediterranea (strain MF3/22) TaxID=694068 RepID=UPI000440803F|nr:uncharacterized protein FOMMEDRAFT_18454 [Fomitiporia mediterranea MF3/22]EJD04691.1 hypothetical protein FOMMEDRAFT_18454 [Fomitiporia mediterranea MF3/22]